MPDERVFHVSTGLAAPAQPVALAQAGFRQRDDLQEWGIAHPEILGEDVLILTSEYCVFSSKRKNYHQYFYCVRSPCLCATIFFSLDNVFI